MKWFAQGHRTQSCRVTLGFELTFVWLRVAFAYMHATQASQGVSRIAETAEGFSIIPERADGGNSQSVSVLLCLRYSMPADQLCTWSEVLGITAGRAIRCWALSLKMLVWNHKNHMKPIRILLCLVIEWHRWNCVHFVITSWTWPGRYSVPLFWAKVKSL